MSGHLYGTVPSGLPSKVGVGLAGTVGYIPRLHRTRTDTGPRVTGAVGCTGVLRNAIHKANVRTYNAVVYHSTVDS